MENIEKRIYDRIIEESKIFEETHERKLLPQKKDRIKFLGKLITEELQGEAIIEIKNYENSASYTIKSDVIVDTKEAGSLLEMLKLCDSLIIKNKNGNVELKMFFEFWEWIDAKKEEA